MFWPTLLRFIWFLITSEYLGHALSLLFHEAGTAIDLIRTGFGFAYYAWAVDNGTSANKEATRRKDKRRRKKWERLYHVIGSLQDRVLIRIDQAVTWAIGDEPTVRETLTWTKPRFRNQTRVRKQRSSGQGSNKRVQRTSGWFKTASIVCLLATSSQAHKAPFNSDSVIIHVDNCASRCITNSLGDFVRPPQKVVGRVKGMGGDKVAVSAIGTIRWTFDDDNGRTHTFLIPGTLYIPESPARLLSPQHWAQERKDDTPVKDGTWQATFADHVLLVWGQRTYSRKIPFDKSNVATFATSAGCKNFRMYQACHEAVGDATELQGVKAFNVNIIFDDEDDEPIASTEMAEQFSAQGGDGASEPATKEQEQKARSEQTDHDQVGYDDCTGNHSTSYDKYAGSTIVEDTELEEELAGKVTPTGELMLWHYRLGHIPFSRLQTMSRQGLLPARLSDCRVPKCAACIYGKMTRRAKRTKGESGKISATTVTGPGSCVSVDQLESSTLGLVGHMKGRPTLQRYRCATIYIDHYSRLSYVHLQCQLTSEETVLGKIAFEKFCEARGVTVKHYHADNGRFADKGFVNHVRANRQSVSYCGVNAHFQNGMAEKRIRDLQDQTTTLLMHAEAKWPDVITANLWPYALREANEALNATPNKVTGKIANQMFAHSDAPTVLRHFHPFGCPVYVLNDKLAAGKSIPKWHKRARMGVYLGRSPNHAQSVALVLNLATGLVSPQFHLKFDDLFETVKGQLTYPNTWKSATHFQRAGTKRTEKGSARQTTNEYQGDTHAREPDNDVVREVPTNEATEEGPTTGTPSENSSPSHCPPDPISRPQDNQSTSADGGNITSSSIRKWSARHKPTQRLIESHQQEGKAFATIARTEDDDRDSEVYHGEAEYEIQRLLADPIAFAASADPDTMYLHEAMRQPDKREFIQAMIDEVTTHTKRGHWKIIPIEEVPEGTRILPAVWAMRRKRKIMSREVYKWKARLNVHGGKQTHGVDYWETYAAALKWSSIRFFLTQTILNKWHTRQLDFVLAYPQADVECDLYLEVPQGFTFEGSRKTHCLKLVKNLYGSKAAGRVWQQHLFKGLSDLGFEQSKTDECVFYRGCTTFMVYTDDGIFCGPDKADIDKCMSDLSSKFEITDEGDIDEYLGVKVTRLDDGRITLTQPHLIVSIIQDLGFKENTKGKDTPAPSTANLNRDASGEDHNEQWDYRSVIGKLNFLEKSTRPDIAYAVHQCARYSSNPKASHASAVRYIVRYLIATKDKGLILAPNAHSFECYVDADFQGGWDATIAMNDSTTAKSRSAFIIMYAGCPIMWASKMQTDIALSTTESEYSALSEAAREVIWLMGLMQEVKDRIVSKTVAVPTIKCTIFEDNEGAKAMAMTPKAEASHQAYQRANASLPRCRRGWAHHDSVH